VGLHGEFQALSLKDGHWLSGDALAAGYSRSRGGGLDGKSWVVGGIGLGGDRGRALSVGEDVAYGSIGRGSHTGMDGK
jgi:hypothetical protein